MERQKLMRMTERSERMYLQGEKRGHPPCHSLPWVSPEKQQSRPGSTELPISCRFYVLARQEQGGKEGGEDVSIIPHQCWS